MADIFISYSRKDLEFVYRLHKALSSEKNKDVWEDLEDIPPAVPWRPEIAAAIEAADNFVFVISPDSAASKECGQELAHAIKQHKRLIPLVYREVDPTALPRALTELNFIYCHAGDDFGSAVESLVVAVETDLEWVKEHTRLLTRAVEWESKERNNSLLLRGNYLESAEAWMAQSGTKKPAPNELQGQFILASRQDETARQRLEQQRAKVAMEAFYRLTYDIREKLKEIPGTNPIRRHFIEGNIKGLSELVEIASDDVHAVRELATNYRALAEILWAENELDEAVQAYRNSNNFTQFLVKHNPSESLYWRDLAAGHMNLGLLALPLKPAEALDEYTQALESVEKAVLHDPHTQPEYTKAYTSMVADLQSRVDSLRQK